MTNELSKQYPDTRGRPRDTQMESFVQIIREAYEEDNLPAVLPVPHNIKRIHRKLWANTSFKELQEEKGIKLRILSDNSKKVLVVCLRKDK